MKFAAVIYICVGMLMFGVCSSLRLQRCPDDWYRPITFDEMAGVVFFWPAHILAITMAGSPPLQRQCLFNFSNR
jgi:hypothetical protein